MNRTLLVSILAVLALGGIVYATVSLVGGGTTEITLADGPELPPVTAARDNPFDGEVMDSPIGDDIVADDESDLAAFLEVVRVEEDEVEPLVEGRPVVVQVKDSETKAPVSDAEVFVVDGYDESERDPFSPHWSELAEANGDRYTTDAEGRVELPAVRRRAIVMAQRPGVYGYTRLGRRHRKVETIYLHPDETVTVRVLDSDDNPVAGVPVALLQQIPERRDTKKLTERVRELEKSMRKVRSMMESESNKREGLEKKFRSIREEFGSVREKLDESEQQPSIVNEERITQRLTDEDGLATIRHFQAYRKQAEGWWPGNTVNRFSAALLMPLRRYDSVPFSGRPVPRETITLRLPPTGGLTLRTIDRDGRPFQHPVHATLTFEGVDDFPWTKMNIRKEQGQTQIEFPFVGLGMLLNAHCRLDDEDFRWELPTFSGPSQLGEEKSVDLIVAPGEGMLHGRILDQEGRPLANLKPTFLINSDAGRLEGEEVITGPDGRFHLPYQVRDHHRGPFEFEVRHDDISPPLGVTRQLRSLPSDYVTDLGDLELGTLTPLASGIVVNDLGDPIRHATIQLQRERDVGGKQARLDFADEAFSVTRTDEEGAFELYATLGSGRYRLKIKAREHFELHTPDLRPGPQGEIVMMRRSQLVGTILTPPWMKVDGLKTKLIAHDDGRVRDDRIHNHDRKKYIYFDWVKPGGYDLEIRTQSLPDPIVAITRIYIEPGQKGVHRLLDEIDLSRFLFRFEITAKNGQGESFRPSRPLVTRIVRSTGQEGFVAAKWNNGRVEILHSRSQLEVWPLEPGYASDRTVLYHGKSELRYHRVQPARLHLPGLRAMAGRTPVRVAVTPADAGFPERLDTWDDSSGRMARWYGGSRWSGAPLSSDEMVKVPLMGNGRYRVLVSLGKRDKRSRMVHREVAVVDLVSASSDTVTVEVDPRLIQGALDELAAAQEKAQIKGR